MVSLPTRISGTHFEGLVITVLLLISILIITLIVVIVIVIVTVIVVRGGAGTVD